jgi:hypothetical protein
VGASRVDGPTYKRSDCFRQVRHHDWRGLMSTLEIERKIKNTVQGTEGVEILDCGRASERTQGVHSCSCSNWAPRPTTSYSSFEAE